MKPYIIFENPYFSFNYSLKGGDIDVLYFSISDESGNAIYILAEMKSVVLILAKFMTANITLDN